MDGLLIGLGLGVPAIALSVQAALALDGYRRRAPRTTWDGVLVWWAMRLYARVWQRATFVGLEHMHSAAQYAGPIILVSNHTGAADPILIQAACSQFEVRWMMMRSMNQGIATWATRYGAIILVEQDGKDLASIRTAMRHLKRGGVIGIFPEGGIARPPGVHRPFQTGVGLLVKRTGATVLPVWISGTPKVDVAMRGLTDRGRARVEFGAPMHFERDRDIASITSAIRDAIASLSGWPDVSHTEGEAEDVAWDVRPSERTVRA